MSIAKLLIGKRPAARPYTQQENVNDPNQLTDWGYVGPKIREQFRTRPETIALAKAKGMTTDEYFDSTEDHMKAWHAQKQGRHADRPSASAGSTPQTPAPDFSDEDYEEYFQHSAPRIRKEVDSNPIFNSPYFKGKGWEDWHEPRLRDHLRSPSARIAQQNWRKSRAAQRPETGVSDSLSPRDLIDRIAENEYVRECNPKDGKAPDLGNLPKGKGMT